MYKLNALIIYSFNPKCAHSLAYTTHSIARTATSFAPSLIHYDTNSLPRSRENVLYNVLISGYYSDAVSTHCYAKKPCIGVGPTVPPLACLLAHSLFFLLTHSLSPYRRKVYCLLTQFQADSPCQQMVIHNSL